MPVSFNDAIENRSPKSFDAYYTIFSNGVSRAYNSKQEILDTVNSAYRSVGQTFLLNVNGVNTEFWFKQATSTLTDLVEKTSGSSSGSQVDGAIFSVFGTTTSTSTTTPAPAP